MSALSIRYGSATTLPLDVLLSMIPSLPRAALSRLTERAIDRMDELDGDCDLEDDDPDVLGGFNDSSGSFRCDPPCPNAMVHVPRTDRGAMPYAC